MRSTSFTSPRPVAPRLPSMMYGLGVPVVIGSMNHQRDFYPLAVDQPFIKLLEHWGE